MNNEELLTLAAKSINLKGNYFKEEVDNEEECYISEGIYCIDENDCGYTWNPLIDDGDALRLAANLAITFHVFTQNGSVIAYCQKTSNQPEGLDIHEFFTSDPCEAVRRAIVRAAADIGNNQLQEVKFKCDDGDCSLYRNYNGGCDFCGSPCL